MPRITTDEYRDGHGGVDWGAHRKACIANGELCSNCGAGIFLLFHENYGVPALCASCRKLKESTEAVNHRNLIRCPKCKHSWSVDEEDGSLYEEGEQWVMCPECGCDFQVTTEVAYSFESPALQVKEA